MSKTNPTDFVLFGEKKLSDLFEEIYTNQRTKKKKIGDLIDEFKSNIRHAGDIAEIGLIIKDLIKFSVENDEMLIKLATLAQRIVAADNKKPGDDGFLSESERAELLEEVERTANMVSKETTEKVTDIEIELQEIQSRLEK